MTDQDAWLTYKRRMELLQDATNLFPRITTQITETSRLKKYMEKLRMDAFSFEHSMILKTTTLWTRISKLEKCFTQLKKQTALENVSTVPPKPKPQTVSMTTPTTSETELSVTTLAQKLTDFGRGKQEPKAVYGIVEVEDRFAKLLKDLNNLISSLEKIRSASPVIEGIERGNPDLNVELMYQTAVNFCQQLKSSMPNLKENKSSQ